MTTVGRRTHVVDVVADVVKDLIEVQRVKKFDVLAGESICTQLTRRSPKAAALANNKGAAGCRISFG